MSESPTSSLPMLSLIGAPTDIGAGTRGAALGPANLRQAGLAQRLHQLSYQVLDCGDLSGPGNPEQTPVHGYRHLNEVIAWNQAVAAATAHELNLKRLPILLGGDHSLGIGSISAVAQHCHSQGKNLRVIWLDAHTDFNTHLLTPTGNLHGMPVACLCGYGPPELVGISGQTPALLPSAIWQIGIRSIDPGEKLFIHEVGLNIIDMPTIQRIGMHSALQMALAGVNAHTHLHVSFDVDFLDPQIAPGVGTPVGDGPDFAQAVECMDILAASGRLGSVDVTELNPMLDPNQQTTQVVISLLEHLLQPQPAS